MSTPSSPPEPAEPSNLSHPSRREAVARIAQFFEAFSPADVARMEEFYTADAFFKDPFNEVRGLPEVRRIFSHMFVALDEPRFIVTSQLVDGDQCFLTWDFVFRFKRFDTATVQTVRGGSHLKLSSDGRIAYHRDYWDAAEELYEKLPVVGGLMRWLKRRANEGA
ncbi:MAG: nuclear transport factor 2 family protein [Pseudomonadota bacterium]